MFFIISKIISFLVHPFSWILIAVAIGFFVKNTKLKKRFFWTAAIATLFFSNTVIFSEFVRIYEPKGTPLEETKHYDVGIVLGGMAEYDNNLKRISLRRGADRMWQAMRLYADGKVKKLMIVGANGTITDTGLNEALQFKECLLEFGVPESDIIIEDESKNTHQNAVEAKKVLNNYPTLSSYLLITSALHMPRAKACFKKAGFTKFDTFTTDHYTGETRGYSLEQFIVPNASNMNDWAKFNHEWVGYFTYWLMGYV